MGLGGGMVLILYLVFFTSVNQLQAQGINLIFFIPIAILSLIIHTKNKLVDWKSIIPSIIVGIVFSVLFSFIALKIHSDILGKIFGGFVLIIGIKSFFTKDKKKAI